MTLTTRVFSKQKNTLSVFALPNINTRGFGRIQDSYTNPR